MTCFNMTNNLSFTVEPAEMPTTKNVKINGYIKNDYIEITTIRTV